jgi:hypothetical protein
MWFTMSDVHNSPETPHQNPTVAFERRDVNVRAIAWFVFGLTILIAICIATVFGVYSHFNAAREQQTRSEFPLAESARQATRKADPAGALPPAPRLDGVVKLPAGQESGRMFPPGPLAQKVNSDVRDLNSWRWVDADHAAACIPITEAMNRLLANSGGALKSRPGGKPPVKDKAGEASETTPGRTPHEGQK